MRNTERAVQQWHWYGPEHLDLPPGVKALGTNDGTTWVSLHSDNGRRVFSHYHDSGYGLAFVSATERPSGAHVTYEDPELEAVYRANGLFIRQSTPRRRFTSY